LPEAIRIGDPAIEVRLRRNARARRMVLRIAASGRGPTLTLPPGVPLAHAQAFLRDHEGWLRNHLATGALRVRVGEGTVLPFGSGTLALHGHGGRGTRRDGEILAVGGRAEDVGPRAAAWLREEARAACVAGVERHAGTLGRPAGRVTLRDPRSRWGSCTAAGDLMFSWRLVMAPPAVLDYVVAHEVAHLVELNHSPRFWTVVRRLCPGMEAERLWLRRNGAALHRYDFGVEPA
jgi:predicted metal-dependent hydrolase